jgi:uncharacterized protein YegJ (DUF2314 family)
MKNVANDDEAMNAAIATAQETLPLFIDAMQTSTDAEAHFAIKVEYPYGSGDDAEHIWVSDLTYDGNRFKGTIGNDPVYVSGLAYGDRVDVQLEEISDWMIIQEGRMLGGYTIHVIRNMMSEREREDFDREAGFTIPEEPELP